MNHRAYVLPAAVTAVATLLLAFLCFQFDLRFASGETQPALDMLKGLNLFSRSGALIALSGAVLEYQLSLSTYLRNMYVAGAPVSLRDLAEAANLPPSMMRLRWFAHFNVAVGTLIWGYGDFAFMDWGKAIACITKSAC